MNSTLNIRRPIRRFGVAALIVTMTLGAAFGQRARSKKGAVGGASPDEYTNPQLLSADTNPTLRYPVASFSGWSVRSTSYGWLDVTRHGIRYAVVQPADKISEGFEISDTEITDIKIEQAYLMFHRGADKRRYSICYLAQDRWGTIHSGPGAMGAASVGALGTASIFQAIKNFDNVLAMVKPPEPTVAVAPTPVAPAPAPKAAEPPSPPAIVVTSPSGAGANQTVETQDATLAVRGVAMDGTGIPAVAINGAAANMRPQNAKAAEFWSDALPLKPGDNSILITASNSAHVEASLVFVVHYAPKVTTAVNAKGLDKADIISLLVGAVPATRIVEIVRDRGLKFTPNADDVKEIRAAGASDDLIQAIQQAAPHS